MTDPQSIIGGWPAAPGMSFQGYVVVVSHKDRTFDLQKSRIIKTRYEAEKCAERWQTEIIDRSPLYQARYEIVIRELFYRGT